MTVEHENIDVQALVELERSGRQIRPGAATLRIAGDKVEQRRALVAAEHAVAPSIAANDVCDAVAERFGLPVVMKAARGGFDGRGVRSPTRWPRSSTLRQPGEGRSWSGRSYASTPSSPCWWRAGRNGESVVYPVVRTYQADGICRMAEVPSGPPAGVELEAKRIAAAITEDIGAVGILAVEFFLVGGARAVNEIAARPHNAATSRSRGAQRRSSRTTCAPSSTGHWVRRTFACQPPQWRTSCPSTTRPTPTGTHPRSSEVPTSTFTLYDKPPRTGRKIGHVTVTGADAADVPQRARDVARTLAQSNNAPVPA